MNQPWQPRAVSFSSGGVRTLGLAGVLAALLETDVLRDVREWYGCSGGCFPTVFGAIGATPAWIRDAVSHLEMAPLVKIEGELVGAIGERWGVSSGAGLLEFFGRIVETWAPGFASWTFADFALAYPAVRLVFIATNVTKGNMKVFGTSETPSVRIMDALRASMSVPLFFTPTVIDSEIFCDGAICEYYPWSCVTAGNDQTLVVSCDERGIQGRPLQRAQPQSLTEYISRLFRISAAQRSCDVPRYWIALNNTVGFLDFKMTREERIAVFDEGVVAAHQWLAFSQSKSQIAAASATQPSQTQSALPYTSPTDPVPCSDKRSGIHRSDNRTSMPCPCRSRQNESGRRWSL
jgi:predicted acylesterase/phospholipase RssA